MTETLLPSIAYPPTPDATSSWNRIPLGVDSNADQVVWNLELDPTMLLLGGTGTGKSVALRNLILHCIHHSEDIKFFGVDLWRVEFKPFSRYAEIAVELEETQTLLQGVWSELQTRYTQMEEQGVNHFTKLATKRPAYLILIDEAYSVINMPAYEQNKAEEIEVIRAEIAATVLRIARLGRATGIYLAVAAQNPISIISHELRSQFSFLYLTGGLSFESSMEWFGSSVATDIPRPVRGRGLTTLGAQETIIQGYFVSQEDVHQAAAGKSNPTR